MNYTLIIDSKLLFVNYFIFMNIPAQRNQLIETFLHYNSQINLSAIRDPEGVYLKHILDSLELLKVLDLRTGDVLSDGGHIAMPREGDPSLRSG